MTSTGLCKQSIRGSPGAVLTALMVAAAAGGVATPPARADSDDFTHGYDRGHERKESHERREGRESREWRDSRGWHEAHPDVYVAPGAVYAPPPVVYAPPPVEPSLNIVIPLEIR